MEYRKSKLLQPGSKVWIYARHSPGKNQSIDAQLSALHGYCVHNGFVIVEQFLDAGQSGGNRNRDGFNRLRKLVEDNTGPLVDGLICFDGSRFARDFKDADYTKALLRFKGYVIDFLDQDYPDGIAGRIVEVVDDYENEKYLRVLKLKTKEGLRHLLTLTDENGAYLGVWPTRPPWGFQVVQRELPIVDTVTKKPRVKQCIIPDEALFELGRTIYILRGADGLTYRQIEERTGFLTNRGMNVTTTDALGRYYALFFRNPIYKGTLRYREITIPNYVPAMVPSDLWQAANETAVAHRRGNWAGYRNPKTGKGDPVFVLSGLCKCAYCDALCYPITVKNYRYYKCGSRKRIGVEACPPSKPHPASLLEQAILDHSLNVFLADDFIGELTDLANELMDQLPDNSAQIGRIGKEIADLDRRYNNLLDLAEQGNKVSERLKLLEKQRQAKEEERQRLIRETPERLHLNVSEVLEIFYELRRRLLESGEVKQVFHQIIDFIRVSRERVTVYYRMPLGVADIWRTLACILNLPTVCLDYFR